MVTDFANEKCSTWTKVMHLEFVPQKTSRVTRKLSTKYPNAFIPLWSPNIISYISKFGILFACYSRIMRFHIFTLYFEIASYRYASCIFSGFRLPLFKAPPHPISSFIHTTTFLGNHIPFEANPSIITILDYYIKVFPVSVPIWIMIRSW